MNQNSSTCSVDPWISRAADSCLDLWGWLQVNGNRCLDLWEAVQGPLVCVQSLQFAGFPDFHWFCWSPSLGKFPGTEWIRLHSKQSIWLEMAVTTSHKSPKIPYFELNFYKFLAVIKVYLL